MDDENCPKNPDGHFSRVYRYSVRVLAKTAGWRQSIALIRITHGWETAGCSRHAGQFNFPRIVCRPIRLVWKKLRGFVTKKAQEACFVSPRRKAIFPMDSPLSQHKKRSLPSDIRYFPFALVNYSVTPTLTYFWPRWNSAANQRAQHCAGKGRRQSVNEYSGWRHTMARSYGIAVGLLVWKLLFLSLR